MVRMLLGCVPLLALACAHQEEKRVARPAAPAPAPSVQREAPAAPAPVAAKESCRGDGECGPDQLCIDGSCVAIRSAPNACAASVHFDFDSSQLQQDEARKLERTSRCLRAERTMQFAIEGNADDRGTSEYNLALGDQRARAVLKYLEHLGAKVQQMNSVSFGEERPVCTEATESCYHQNRRTEVRPKKDGN